MLRIVVSILIKLYNIIKLKSLGHILHTEDPIVRENDLLLDTY